MFEDAELVLVISSYTDISSDKVLGTVLYINKIKESCDKEIVSFENFSILKLIELSVQVCLQSSKDKHIKINYSSVDDIKIKINFWFLQQAVANIINSAIYRSTNNSEIIIKSYKTDKYFVLSFRDFGKGLNAEQLQFLFDDTVILKDDCTESGRGLFIAKTIAEAHKGFITGESKINLGSTFLLHLPLES